MFMTGAGLSSGGLTGWQVFRTDSKFSRGKSSKYIQVWQMS